MTDFKLLNAADVQLMQGMAQRLAATRPEMMNADTTYGELAWNWGKGHTKDGASWPRKLWFSGGDLVAWAWAQLPRRVTLSDGVVRDIKGASLPYQVHPDHADLVDEVIEWFDQTAGNVERTVLPAAADEYALQRWIAHGYETDTASLGDNGSWTQLNERDLTDVEQPVLPDGFRFLTANEAGPAAAVQAHQDAWVRTTYTNESYEGLRKTASYRGDLHLLVEAPDGTMAASAIMWLDEVNKSIQFEPVGTHQGYRRQGLGRTMTLHGLHLAREAGANHATVACKGAPGHPQARGLYYSVGFREFSREVPLIKRATAGDI